MMTLRAGRRHLHIPDTSVRVSRRAVASGAATWWLSGSINAANALIAYQPKGAADLAASYVNLANPGTYNAAPIVAPTWSSGNGWQFDGTQYLNSGLQPSANTWSVLCRFSSVTNVGKLLGSYSSLFPTGRFDISPNNASSRCLYGNSGLANQFLPVTPQLASGVIGFTGQIAFRNGLADGVIPSTAFSGSLPSIYIGAGNPIVTLVPVIGNIQAVAIYNTQLTLAQMAAVTTAMQAL